MKLDPHQDQSMRVELDDDVTASDGRSGVVVGIDPDTRIVSAWDQETTHRIPVGEIETINQQETRPRAGAFPPPPSKDTP